MANHTTKESVTYATGRARSPSAPQPRSCSPSFGFPCNCLSKDHILGESPSASPSRTFHRRREMPTVRSADFQSASRPNDAKRRLKSPLRSQNCEICGLTIGVAGHVRLKKADLQDLLPLLHTLVEERGGLPAVSSAVSPVKAEALAKAGGEEVPFSMEVHAQEVSHRLMPPFMSQPCKREGTPISRLLYRRSGGQSESCRTQVTTKWKPPGGSPWNRGPSATD
jgi:hypothetical protein